MTQNTPAGASFEPPDLPQDEREGSELVVPPTDDEETDSSPPASVDALLEGSVADLRGRIADIDDADLLEAALEAETRVSGRTAIESRLAELSESEEESEDEPEAESVAEEARVIRAGGYRIGPRGGWVIDKGD